MNRKQTAVIIRHVRETTLDRTTTFYGPFLPHCGAAVQAMIERLAQQDAMNHRVQSSESYVEDVFIGDGESDCRIEATR